jgi:predicted ATPase
MGNSIDKLTIKGFKSIRSLENFELRRLNILIGANGAGKSNFVDFFTMLRSMVEQNLQAYVREYGGADAHLFLGPKVTQEISAELHFPPNRYGFTLRRTVHIELFFVEEREGYYDKNWSFGKGHGEARLKDTKDHRGVLGGARRRVLRLRGGVELDRLPLPRYE